MLCEMKVKLSYMAHQLDYPSDWGYPAYHLAQELALLPLHWVHWQLFGNHIHFSEPGPSAPLGSLVGLLSDWWFPSFSSQCAWTLFILSSVVSPQSQTHHLTLLGSMNFVERMNPQYSFKFLFLRKLTTLFLLMHWFTLQLIMIYYHLFI